MDTYIYKCPNCDSGLEYDAKTHIFHCDYCRSDFTAEELEENKFSWTVIISRMTMSLVNMPYYTAAQAAVRK